MKLNYFVNTALIFERDLSVVLSISVSFFRDILFLKRKWEEVFVNKKKKKKGQNEMKSLSFGNTGRRSLSKRREEGGRAVDGNKLAI